MSTPKTFVSRIPHEITILPPVGEARQIATGEVVDFDDVVGTTDDGAPVTLEACLETWQREQFEPNTSTTDNDEE